MVSVSNVASLGEKFRELQKTFKDLEMARIPLVEDTAAKESCIDQLVDSLKQEPASTQCVFSCQAGLGRTTLGITFVLCLYIIIVLPNHNYTNVHS